LGEKIEKGSKGIYIPGNKSAVPKLSLLLGKDSFFCIHIDAHQRLTFYRTARKSSFKQSVIEWLEESIRLSELLKESKLEVWVGLIQPHYTFVPVPLYQEEHRDLYAQRAFYLPLRDATWTDSITTRDYIKVLYEADRELYKMLYQFLPEVSCTHFLTPLLRRFYEQFGDHNKTLCLANVRGGYLTLAVFVDGKLIFANLFEWQKDEDIYYYLALMVNQLELEPNKLVMHLSGEWTPDSDRHKWVRRKFKQWKWTHVQNHIFSASVKKHELQAFQLYDLVSPFL